MRPRLNERDWADSKRTFCHSQGSRRLLRRYRPQVDGQVHRRSRRHEALQEAGGQRPGPLAQVQRAHETPACLLPRQADSHVAAVDLHLHGRLLACLSVRQVHLRGRTAEGGCQEEHPKLTAPERMHGQPGPRQQAAQLVNPPELADGVEAPVQDAVALFQARSAGPRRDSAAARVCGGRSPGCVFCRSCRRRFSPGGCWRTRSCAGKSRALSAPAKAPSFGSSSSRPITSQMPTFTPSRRTGPSSSRCDSMKQRGSGSGGLALMLLGFSAMPATTIRGFG